MAVDVGIKNNQIRCLATRGVCVKVVPWDYDYSKEGMAADFTNLQRFSDSASILGLVRC